MDEYSSEPYDSEPSEFKLLKDAVEEVKDAIESIDGTLTDLNKTGQKACGKIDADFKDLFNAFVSQKRTDALRFALDHLNLGCFTYQHVTEEGEILEMKSCEILAEYLMAFTTGGGLGVSDDKFIRRNEEDSLPTEKEKKRFREELVKQIEGLTGIRPEITQKDKAWALFLPDLK